MDLELNFQTAVIAWLVLASVILWRHAYLGRSVGLLLGYILSLAALHWFAPALQLLPWSGNPDVGFTLKGMQESLWALVGLAIGAELVTRRERRHMPTVEETGGLTIVSPRLVNVYLVSGALLYAFLFTAAGQLPTVRALLATGATLIAVGVGLKCRNAWAGQRWAALAFWMGTTALFPLMTVIVQGFLGYGMAAMVMVWTFIAGFHRPRLKELTLAVALAYVGLSVYVTYMRDRDDIRELVWHGASTSDRLERVEDTFSVVEWFDPRRLEHYDRVDARLNQNFLVGAAVAYLDAGWVDYAEGATFRDAALSIIPRALWQSKTIVAGSGDLVSTYTGFRFGRDTSVGVGQVLECYVNFGTAGVLIGFLVLGAVVVRADRGAWLHLHRGDTSRFLRWYLPGLAVLQVGGSLTEVTATAMASFVLALILSFMPGTAVRRAETPEESSSLVRVTS